jgi:hypothetical protein
MATKRSIQPKRATKKRGEKPVTRIKEAAERAAGILSREDFTAWLTKRKAAESFPITLTLGELCNLIAYEINPEKFASSALSRLAEDFDVLSDLVERRESAGYESWKTMQGMRCRMEFAARVVAQLDKKQPETAVAS